MNEIELVKPNPSHETKALDYIQEHKNNNEFDLHGGALLEKSESFAVWLKQLAENSDKSTVNKDWVISSTFFAIRRKDEKIMGMVDIRHELNDFLESYGGHIGLGVRPTERNKGYATEILKKALNYCKELGLSKVMVACYKENTASAKVISKCGGILEKEFVYTDGKVVQIFWITTY
jgi:predicted acetyltransferase